MICGGAEAPVRQIGCDFQRFRLILPGMQKRKLKSITKQKSSERRNSPQSSASGGAFAGFGNQSGEIFLIGFVMALLVFLAAAAPARAVAPKSHG